MINPQIIYKIQQLLDRYYNGESTQQDEAELLALLTEHTQLPESMKTDAELFLQMSGISTLATQQAESEAMNHLPEGFEERLQSTLDKLAIADQQTQTIPNTQPMIGVQPKRSLTWLHKAAACASVVVVLGAAIGYMAMPDDPFTDTCATTEQAEYQLNRALTLVNTFSQAGLSEARIGTQEQVSEALPASKFISFD